MKLKQLFINPETWQKGWFASNKEGEPCDGRAGYAVCWCLKGAIERCYYSTTTSISALIVEYLRKHFSDRLPPEGVLDPIVIFNDHKDTTFADIKQLVEDLNI